MVCTNVYEGAINQVYFNVDTLCKDELIKKFTKEFPECNTIMVYGKKLVNG